ncbi:MAG TPA: 4Fe-4S ferredoxin, partial [Phaeodactylibacter sp.]|nr:4Fe-4S ferredoxin [Phaeodactylibacter sp.]
MKKNKQNFWVGVAQLKDTQKFEEISSNEFPEELPLEKTLTEEVLQAPASRRDFLKYLGFGLGAATIAASCDIPVKRAIPYVVKPDEIVPGIANYYASTFVRGGDYCSVLVKTREGRPIKIEGNSLCPVTKGGTSARAQASVLDLYNVNRFQGPGMMKDGKFKAMSWEELDKKVSTALSSAAVVRILTHTNLSPTFKAVLKEFTERYPGAKVLTYDPVSCSALLQASEATHGAAIVPEFHFDKADTIVSFGADFLGTWISPVEYARQYTSRRRIEDVKRPNMSYHVQVESHMSLTGSNADKRILIRPSEQGAAIAALYNALAAKNGAPAVAAPKINDKAAAAIRELSN